MKCGDQEPCFILLLGSYDPHTKSLLNSIKEFIAKKFQEEIYGTILEDVEIYICDEKGYAVLVEKEKPIAYIFYLNKILDVLSLKSGDDFERSLREILKEKHGVNIEFRLPILRKLQELAKFSKPILIVRERELTRGGEYVELAFLLLEGTDTSKIVFLWNNKVDISSMVKELLDACNFNFRPYSSEKELLDEVYRLIYYKIIEGNINLHPA